MYDGQISSLRVRFISHATTTVNQSVQPIHLMQRADTGDTKPETSSIELPKDNHPHAVDLGMGSASSKTVMFGPIWSPFTTGSDMQQSMGSKTKRQREALAAWNDRRREMLPTKDPNRSNANQDVNVRTPRPRTRNNGVVLDLQATMSKLEDELASKDQQISVLEADLLHQDNMVAGLRDQASLGHTAFQELSTTKEKLDNEVLTLRQMLLELRNYVRPIEKRVQRLTTEKRRTWQAHLTQIRSLRNESIKNKSDISNAQYSIQQLQHEVSRLEEDKKHLQQTISHLRKREHALDMRQR
ncbi:hypothetical protein EYR36_005081 [Pleurotus pulmonarius]|nr:hypothetical protein EYR36_005081 [Pleurotus pulmonarius]